MQNSTFTGRIIRYIEQLESGQLARMTVLKLSEQLDINRSVLYRKFVKELGMTPATFLVTARKHSLCSIKRRVCISDQVSSYIEALPLEQLAVLTVELLAEKFDISSSYLVRVFKKEKNISLSRYILMTKIERSTELLRLNLDVQINDVARTLGFHQPESYLRAFEQIKGVTPYKYKSISA